MIAQFITWLQQALQNCLSLDFGVLDFIQQYCANPIMDKIMPIVTMLGDAGIFWIVIALILLVIPKTRKIGLSMGVALAIGVLVCNVWLKNAVERCRPFLDQMPDKHDVANIVDGWFSQFHNGQTFNEWFAKFHDAAVLKSTTYEGIGETVKLLVEAPDDFSFPSGHTIASFEACTVLMVKNRWMGVPATILAIAIAFSRMYLYVHYPTDVLAAAVMGILFGLLAVLLVNIFWHFLPKRSSAGSGRSRSAGKYLAK